MIELLIYIGLSFFVFMGILFVNKTFSINDIGWVICSPLTIMGWMAMTIVFCIGYILDFFENKIDGNKILIDIRKEK
jgi:hypothetical protein